MKELITTLDKIFTSLRDHPTRETEVGEMLKGVLNNHFGNSTCAKVFISKGKTTSDFVISVIPYFPQTGKLFETTYLTTYDIDINVSWFNKLADSDGFQPEDMTTWLLHELFANIITDTTFLRYKKQLTKFYDINNGSVMNVIKVYGDIPRIGIFGNTIKEYISGNSTDSTVNKLLDECGLKERWNDILTRYVCRQGGSYNIISPEYVDRMDRAQFRMFNEIARKYSAYVVKYNNKDYYDVMHYFIAGTGSELLKFYCEKEPKQVIAFKEEEVYNLFDDRKLLRDTDNENITFSKEKDYQQLKDEFDTIVFEYGSSDDNAADMLLAMVKVKDLYNEISNRMVIDKETALYPQLSLLQEKIIQFMNGLKDKGYDETKVSVMTYDEED